VIGGRGCCVRRTKGGSHLCPSTRHARLLQDVRR
jgi:hypothetical protein